MRVAKLKILGISILIKVAPRDTVWSYEIRSTKTAMRQRQDVLFGVSRIFLREPGVYIYEIYLGQLRITVANDKKAMVNPRLQAWLKRI